MKPHVAFYCSLAEQLEAIQRATPGVCAGDAEALHAWRVAVRRQRTLLGALPRKHARAIGAKGLQNKWRTWNRRLGPARDADVWCEALRDPALRRALGATAEGRAFLRAQQQRRKVLKTPLGRLLQSPQYVRLVRRTETLVARELPAYLSAIGAGRLVRSTRRAFSRLLGRAQPFGNRRSVGRTCTAALGASRALPIGDRPEDPAHGFAQTAQAPVTGADCAGEGA